MPSTNGRSSFASRSRWARIAVTMDAKARSNPSGSSTWALSGFTFRVGPCNVLQRLPQRLPIGLGAVKSWLDPLDPAQSGGYRCSLMFS